MNDAVSDAPFTPPLTYDIAIDHEATSSNRATPNIEDPRERDEGIRPHAIQERTSEAFCSILFDGSAAPGRRRRTDRAGILFRSQPWPGFQFDCDGL